MTESSSQAPFDQKQIWRHFQNVTPEMFDAARPRLDFLLAQLRKHCLMKHPVILNVGVGNGYFERQAIQRRWEIHSLDPDAQALASLEMLNVQTHVGSVEAIPLDSQSCDGVVVSEVLEHLTKDQGKHALSEIARVLKPGGVFLGTVPYNEDLRTGQAVCPHCGALFHRWGHHRSFTSESLHRELGEYFVVKKIRRTAFVSCWGGGLPGTIKSLVRVALAKCGQMIAVPSLFWHAVK